jgi:nucleotide-binding universal stress UspA family protein
VENILVLIHDDTGQEARIQAAFDLTRMVSGHLTCLDVVRLPEFIRDYKTTAADMIFGVDEDVRSDENRLRLEPRLLREEFGWDWVKQRGDIAEIVSHRVDLSDIIVLNTDLHDRKKPDMLAASSAAAVKAHKPVLAVPEGHLGFNGRGRAIIAWDGSGPASAILRMATPLFAFAETITLVEIDAGDGLALGKIPASDAATYLSRHGIDATLEYRPNNNAEPTSTMILAAAQDLSADYIVLGAYGHSRMSETILGGVSRSILVKTKLPLVLGH